MKNLKFLSILLFLIGFIQVSISQPDTLWTKKIEGYSVCSVLDRNGTLILCTQPEYLTDSTSISILLLIDLDGKITDQKEVIFNQSCNMYEGRGTIITDLEIHNSMGNGLLLSGLLYRGGIDMPGGHYGSVIKKLDINLNSIFEKEYDFLYERLCGNQDGDFWLSVGGEIQKYNSNGDSLFAVEIGDYNIFDLLEISDGVMGIYGMPDMAQVRMVKINHERDIVLDKVLNDSVRYPGNYNSVYCKTSHKGYLYLSDYNQLTRHDSCGLIISKTVLLDDSLTPDVNINAIINTSDGGIVKFGDNLMITKNRVDGAVLWSKKLNIAYGGQPIFAKETPDYGILILGESMGETWIAKLEPDLTVIKNDAHFPSKYFLHQNYPNPFNPTTTIEFTLPKSEITTLKVFNTLGQEIATIVSTKLNQGNHTYTFNGKNLASGVYYYQLVAGNYREVKKMILLK